MTIAPDARDFAQAEAVGRARAASGQMAYLAGLAAEDSVAADYAARGYVLRDVRWRGKRGEIDLIFGDGDAVVMVEVKKSRSFEAAMARVSPAQVRRLFATGEEYLGTCPLGALTDVRFDVALVDQVGQVSVIENAFCGWV